MNKTKLMIFGVLCLSMMLLFASCGGDDEAKTPAEEAAATVTPTDDKILTAEEQKALDAETKSYKEKLGSNAADATASIELSDKYVEYGQYSEAANTIKQAITYAPENTELYDELIDVYQQSGNTVEALSYIDTIADDALRRKYLDEAYDRTSDNALVMGNTTGNHTTGGMMAFEGDVVYYCDAANGNALTKLENGANTVLLKSNIDSLNIVGDFLYFVDKSDYCIYKMKKDGTEKSKVNDAMATDLMVFGKKMYFINWGDECKIYSMNIDGSELTKVTDMSTDTLYIYGAYMYITDRNSQRELYRVSLEDGSSYMISMDDTYFVTGYDNNIYFRAQPMSTTDDLYGEETQSGNLAIYRMTTDGTVYEQINDARSGYLNADKGEIFFTNFEEEALYKANADGTGLVKLTDGDPSYTSVNGDYLYYFSDTNGKKLYRIRKDGTGKECLN